MAHVGALAQPDSDDEFLLTAPASTLVVSSNGVGASRRRAAPTETRSRHDICANARAAKAAKRASTDLDAGPIVPRPGPVSADGDSLIVPQPDVPIPCCTDGEITNVMDQRSANLDFGLTPFYDVVRRLSLDDRFISFEIPSVWRDLEALFCDSHMTPPTKDRAASTLSAISSKHSSQVLHTFASSLAISDEIERYNLERTMADMCKAHDHIKPLYFLEYSRFDETPMKLVMKALQY
eukprot:1165261-Pyramimonas_sp.AAC.1